MENPSANPPRRHHYVPRLLLRRFTDADGILWIYDLEKGAIYPGNPDSAGFIRDLYSRTGPDGADDHSHVETLLATRVDAPASKAINRLLKRETLETDWNDFLIFVAAQLLRTPASFERMAAMMKPIGQEMLERMARHEPRFREGVRAKMIARGASEEEVARALESAATGKMRVKPTKDFVLSTSLAMLEGIFEELRGMKWQIATLAETDPDLIIGDHPTLQVVPAGELVGLRHPQIDLKLPLSSRVAAVGNWDGEVCYAIARAGFAEQMNEETMCQAKRFVFASHRSDTLLAKAKQLHGSGPRVTIGRHEADGKLMIIPQYR